MLFKAIVKDKQSKELTIIESEYPTKQKFIEDLRGNGYSVNPEKVKRSEVFEYIMKNTNCEPWDWMNWDMDKEGNIIEVDRFEKKIDRLLSK